MCISRLKYDLQLIGNQVEINILYIVVDSRGEWKYLAVFYKKAYVYQIQMQKLNKQS